MIEERIIAPERQAMILLSCGNRKGMADESRAD